LTPALDDDLLNYYSSRLHRAPKNHHKNSPQRQVIALFKSLVQIIGGHIAPITSKAYSPAPLAGHSTWKQYALSRGSFIRGVPLGAMSRLGKNLFDHPEVARGLLGHDLDRRHDGGGKGTVGESPGCAVVPLG
jgi:hypothetical protein